MRRFVEVNEASIFATGTAAEWWVLYEAHQPTSRITVMAASIGGNRVRVECDDDEHAEQFVQMLAEHGAPKNAAKALPAPKLGYEHYCPHRVSVHCGGPKSGKPTTQKCSTCGGRWIVRRGTYGVFTWTGTGRYNIAAAHATFASQARADARAAMSNGQNWVVRFIDEGSL